MGAERVDTVVIGGGQAGLAAGYYLAQQGRDFVILEAGERVGEAWRRRWDSLRLFTPACFNHLPGMPFPAHPGYLLTKSEMADYLEAYATRFGLPVQFGVRVDALVGDGGGYRITTGARRLEANHIVVATGATTTPRVPSFASQVDPAITQLHSVEYRNPSQLRGGAVLVVGAGNSGAEIALELASSRPTWLAGPDTGHIPITLGCFAYQLMQRLTVDTWLGRKLAAKGTSGGAPLVRVRPGDLLEAGIQRVHRVARVSSGLPVLEGGRVLEVENIVWCTGFVCDYHWITLPVFDANGAPAHHRGMVPTEPGLYFVGLPFQSSLASHLVGGVGADAQYVVEQIARRVRPADRLGGEAGESGDERRG